MDDGEFEFVYYFNHDNIFSLSNMQRKKGSKRIEMIIKMVNEFKLMQIWACVWIYR